MNIIIKYIKSHLLKRPNRPFSGFIFLRSTKNSIANKKVFLLNVIKKGFKFRQTWQKFISFGLKILGRTCCVEHFLNRFASALMLRWDSQTCPTKLFNKKNTSVDICVSIYTCVLFIKCVICYFVCYFVCMCSKQ